MSYRILFRAWGDEERPLGFGVPHPRAWGGTVLLMLVMAHAASAQLVVQPGIVNPYSRTALGPYLNPQLRPYIIPEAPMYAMPGYYGGPFESAGGLQYPDEWVNQRINELRLPATGAPSRYQVYMPYYNLPNHNSIMLGAPQYSPYQQSNQSTLGPRFR